MTIPTTQEVKTLFDGITQDYDRFNQLTSFGRDGYWRRQAVKMLRPGMRVLDLGAGTGDLSFEAMREMKAQGEVVGLDFSQGMLDLAEKKRKERNISGNFRWVARSAEDLPFENKPYDVVVSGFVLRNLIPIIDRAMEGVYKSLKPGGVISFVDLTEPENPLIRFGSRIYMRTGIVLIGKLCFGKRYPAVYLSDSMKRFFRASQFKELLKKKGFVDVKSKAYLLGVVTHYTARKP